MMKKKAEKRMQILWKRGCRLALTGLLISCTLQAQNKSAGINLSLAPKVATQPYDSLQTTYLNIGFTSKMNQLRGISMNVVGSRVIEDAKGIQLSGFYNQIDGNIQGLQFSGFANINGEDMRGVSVTSLVNIAGRNAKGIQVSGLANITGDTNHGISMSGLINLTGSTTKGWQIGGLASITGEQLSGLMTSGALNVVGGNMSGIQMAGLGNITGGTMRGLQLSGLGNVVGVHMIGLQLAPMNYTTNGSGLQIGLLNYYKENFDGFQLGLVNANPDTRVQLMVYGGNNTKGNVAARFKNELFYTILGVGGGYRDLDKFTFSTSYRAGLELPLYRKLYISGDLGYQNIFLINNKDKEAGIPGEVYELAARLNLEYKFTKKFTIFATGGYGTTRYYSKSKTFDKGAIFEGGIVLF